MSALTGSDILARLQAGWTLIHNHRTGRVFLLHPDHAKTPYVNQRVVARLVKDGSLRATKRRVNLSYYFAPAPAVPGAADPMTGMAVLSTGAAADS